MDNDQNIKNSTDKNKILQPDKKKIKGEKKIVKQEKVKTLPNKKSKYLAIVDDTTGEVESYIKLKPKNLGTGWIALFQNPAAWLCQQHMTGEQLNVLLYLFSRLDFDNYLRISLKDIAEWTGIHTVNVSKAMKVLKDMNIIVEGPRAGLNKTYRLNPYIAHKGKDVKNTTIDFTEAVKKKNNKKENNDD